MSAVKATSNGSKGFTTQAPALAHLLSHGVAGEVKNLYTALYAVLGLEHVTTVDEWSGPGSGATLELSYAPRIRMGTALVVQEIVDGAAISPPTGTLSQSGPTDGGAVVTGSTDITASGLYGSGGTLAGGGTGLTLILNVNGGGSTTLTFNSAGTGNDANEAAMLAAIEAEWPALTATAGGPTGKELVLTDTVTGYANTIVVGAGTANTALGLTAGTYHGYNNPGGSWLYTPATAPNSSTAAVVTGTADLSQAALYGSTGTLNGLTLILNVNGRENTVTFSSPINPVNPPLNTTLPASAPYKTNTILNVLNSAFPGLTATVNGSNYLVLTDKYSGSTQTIVVVGGTALTALGLTVGSTAGTGHSYAIVYEVDGALIPGAVKPVTGESYSGGPGTGSPQQMED